MPSGLGTSNITHELVVPQLKTKKDYIHKVFTVVWADIGKTVVEENANNIDT